MDFDTFDRDVFLRDFWQQRPLLIRNPWNDWTNPLDPDELAGLACDDDIESRLITQARPASSNTALLSKNASADSAKSAGRCSSRRSITRCRRSPR
jgi:ribosomal protein L16 Arg81 hydroxylase